MTARARDLRTTSDATPVVINQVDLRLRVDGSNRQVLSIASSPALPGLDQLVGCPVGPGFRSRANEACPGEREAGTLLHLLLDDLPGAALVSGYSAQRAGALDQPRRRRPKADAGSTSGLVRMMASQDDLCAGWAHEGTLMVTIRSTGEIPVSTGPPAPSLERHDDPVAWHPMPPLPPHAMRRRRRLDVEGPGDTREAHRFNAHFRDSHVDQHGAEWVVHEYSATGGFDIAGGRVLDIGPRPTCSRGWSAPGRWPALSDCPACPSPSCEPGCDGSSPEAPPAPTSTTPCGRSATWRSSPA